MKWARKYVILVIIYYDDYSNNTKFHNNQVANSAFGPGPVLEQ